MPSNLDDIPGDIKLDGNNVVVDGTLKLDNIDGKTSEFVRISEARLKRATIGVLTGDFGIAKDELLCKARKLMFFNPKMTEANKKTGIALSQTPDTDLLVINEGGGYQGVTIEAGANGLKITGKMEVAGQLLLASENKKVDLAALVLQLQEEIADLKKQVTELKNQ